MFKLFLIAALFSLVAGLAYSAPRMDLEGVWLAQTYRLAGGQEHALRGHMFFTGDQWTVLYFVLDEQGEPVRASAEGGRFRLDGDRLTFIHRYHFSGGKGLPGLPESAFRMNVSESGDSAAEPCRVRLQDGRLTILFPSGNGMEFTAGEK